MAIKARFPILANTHLTFLIELWCPCLLRMGGFLHFICIWLWPENWWRLANLWMTSTWNFWKVYEFDVWNKCQCANLCKFCLNIAIHVTFIQDIFFKESVSFWAMKIQPVFFSWYYWNIWGNARVADVFLCLASSSWSNVTIFAWETD